MDKCKVTGEEERSAAVAWLRAGVEKNRATMNAMEARGLRGMELAPWGSQMAALEDIADCLERGDHLRADEEDGT